MFVKSLLRIIYTNMFKATAEMWDNDCNNILGKKIHQCTDKNPTPF